MAALPANGQDGKSVIRGKIVYDKTREKSWDNHKLMVPFTEIEATLQQQIYHPAPYPDKFPTWEPAKRLEWETRFVESEAGKKFIAERERLIKNAHSFDIKFEPDGAFVIFDVPTGVYGIHGRVDKTIGETEYGFEIFGKIEVVKGVDEVALKPLLVEITPRLMANQPAPPLNVKTQDSKSSLDLKSYGDEVVFLNFWSMASPTAAAEQAMVHKMAESLKSKFKLKLVSINIDPDREKALWFLVDSKLESGDHGFTSDFGHRILFDYGVRSFPSFWIIKDGKIVMTQYEFAQTMRIKPDLATIVSDRLLGRDSPTPASPTPAKTEAKQSGVDK